MGTTIKGQNLRVLVGTTSGQEKCIAMATSCQFHVAAEVQDSSTKDDSGDWQKNEVVGLSWDAQTDSLVTLNSDSDTTGEYPVDLFSAMINKTKLKLVFDVTNGTQNRVKTTSALKKSGECFITDISITAANRQNSTLSVKFVGSGALA